MEDRVKDTVNFYLTATKLKELIRSGWNDKHWDIKGRLESVAEHVYGTCILAISIYSNFDYNLDFNKVLKMLVLHEIGEVLIGDITPYENVSLSEKQKIEHEAFDKILSDLMSKEEYYNLLIEFDEHESDESKFSYMIDKLEADIQAKVYQDKNLVHDLDDDVNDMFKSERFLYARNNGDKNMFDVWYRYDSDKYVDDEVFKSILNYVKDNNTNI